MDWKDILTKIAPTVATAVLGPLGGAALTSIASILGIDQKTEAAISKAIMSGQLTADQVAQLKQLEMQYQNEEAERGFKYAELVYKDVADARQRESVVKDNVNRNLAYVIVGAFLALVGSTLLGYARVDSVLAGTLVGYLSAKCEQVLAYYFGSSRGSDKKTELLAAAKQ